jgi:hypothetical protein
MSKILLSQEYYILDLADELLRDFLACAGVCQTIPVITDKGYNLHLASNKRKTYTTSIILLAIRRSSHVSTNVLDR